MSGFTNRGPGFIPMQAGLSRYRQRTPTGYDRDGGMLLNQQGQPSYFGSYQRSWQPMPEQAQQSQGQIQATGQPMPGDMSQGVPQGPVRGTTPFQTSGPRQWQTGGGLQVEGGPDAHRPGMYNYDPGAPQPGPRGPLSNPPQGQFGRFDNRRQQVQNMQQKIADYQASAGTDPAWDQNQLSHMQNRLGFLNRMRRSGR